MRTLVFLLFLNMLFVQSYAQRAAAKNLSVQEYFAASDGEFKYTPKKVGLYTAEDWHAAIDATWGQGPSTAEKLMIFNTAWDRLDASFAAFQGLNTSHLDALYALYEPEVAAGVSRGRFAAIMSHMFLKMQEWHTFIVDEGVNFTPPAPGVPLLYLGGNADNTSHFGATLTPLPDSTLLVLKARANHPLGLQAGDKVLGYDGILWKDLIKQLLAYELPFYWGWSFVASNEASNKHNLLTTAGMNWHLFDTLDVVKYGSNQTVHYPTSLLAGQSTFIWGNEQLPVPGIDWIFNGAANINNPSKLPKHISWGVIEGTNIGYINAIAWQGPANWPNSTIEEDFDAAVRDLTLTQKTTGLIIDQRMNYGGVWQYQEGLKHLFNKNFSLFGLDERCIATDHLQMCGYHVWDSAMGVYANSQTLYDHPIAVLTGPAAVSCGDMFPVVMSRHPMSRSFGKPTNGAFSTSGSFDNIAGDTTWAITFTRSNCYLLEDPGNYLARKAFVPQEEVWFDQDDVANGDDTVVKRAMEWINNLAYAHDVAVSQPNPEIKEFNISAKIENPNNHNVSVLAYISIENSAVIDSLSLTEGGAAGTGIWGADWTADNEDNFTISVKTVDNDNEDARYLPNIAHFTSKGPITLEGYSFGNTSDPIGGDDVVMWTYVTIKNEGSVETINDIHLRLVSASPFAEVERGDAIVDSLEAGNTIEINIDSKINLSENINIEMDIPLIVQFYSGVHHYWSDTLFLHVFPLPQDLTVYPGDTDNNGVVNENDILPIGVCFLNEGAERSESSLTWQGQDIISWDNRASCYADANGDGIVDEKDVIAIGVNWANTHDVSSKNYQISLNDSVTLNKYRSNFQTIYNSLDGYSEPTIAIKELLQKTFDFEEAIPHKFVLYQNYPNPFNPVTMINYQLAMNSVVDLSIYNLLGQKVAVVVNKKQAAGEYSVQWDASGFASGLYFYQLKLDNGYQKLRKMLLIK